MVAVASQRLLQLKAWGLPSHVSHIVLMAGIGLTIMSSKPKENPPRSPVSDEETSPPQWVRRG
jgi:hypothetical protein